jgi:hypothetical protein
VWMTGNTICPNGIATGRIDSPNPPERWSLSIKESLIELIS